MGRGKEGVLELMNVKIWMWNSPPKVHLLKAWSPLQLCFGRCLSHENSGLISELTHWWNIDFMALWKVVEILGGEAYLEEVVNGGMIYPFILSPVLSSLSASQLPWSDQLCSLPYAPSLWCSPSTQAHGGEAKRAQTETSAKINLPASKLLCSGVLSWQKMTQ
jgi:hypothetical protein